MKNFTIWNKVISLAIVMFLSLINVNQFQAQNSCQGKTYTMGGWGAPNQGTPQTSYMYAHFNSAFPTGLTIGCPSGYQLKLTSAADITNFLPSGGTPAKLTQSYTNPAGSLSNTLAGQLVSVTLAVVFDATDPNFSVSNSTLGSHYIVDTNSPFYLKTVNQFLALANDFIGGCSSSSYTASQFTEAADKINQSYHEGSVNTGFLNCCTLKIDVTYDPILCNGGTTTVHVRAINGSSSTSGVGDFVVTAGTYTYVISDGDCKDQVTITIGEPTKVDISAVAGTISCFGGNTSVTLTATGGTPPYDIYFNGSLVSDNDADGIFVVTGVVAGTYTYSATDANTCSGAGEKTITVIEPTKLSIAVPSVTVLCYSEKTDVTANVTGGTPPYTVTWWKDGVQVASGLTASLGVGLYTVKVVDANGCSTETTAEVKVQTCNGFTTVTQGGWGAKAAGNNWGAYRDKNFATAFPTGLTIGYGTRFLKLTSAAAVDAFLPSGTTPRALNPGTLTNPGGSYSNVLAGQVVALTMNVGMDNAIATFSSSTTPLRDLIVVSGPMAGKTVGNVLAEANKVLGGEASAFSPSDINGIVDAINNNFDGGKVNLGYLACPCASTPPPTPCPDPKESEPVVMPDLNDVILFPNPSKGEVNLTFVKPTGGTMEILLYNSTGKLMGDLSKNAQILGDRVVVRYANYTLLDGIYIVKVRANGIEKSLKLIIKK